MIIPRFHVSDFGSQVAVSNRSDPGDPPFSRAQASTSRLLLKVQARDPPGSQAQANVSRVVKFRQARAVCISISGKREPPVSQVQASASR